ncbi:MAG TPA: dipeptide ABC transporter ATP-binding protein [Desulfobacteraceae bacterium]|nr:dipeptide ABC transporter ATP-binding protein [Desulfobacteraceae bacterium]
MVELLNVKGLVKHFPVRRGFFGRQTAKVHAVDDVSFTLGENETLGLVGESGCGKSTAGFSILRLIEPTAGEVWFRGENILLLNPDRLRVLRRQMQIVFQDPFGSLNPRLTVERIIEEPLLNHEVLNGGQRRDRVAEALKMVGLLPEHMGRFPHEFSGGQRQRICIARALVLRPSLVVGDEPVSALDVSVRAQVLNLMVQLQRRLNLSYLFISHDLGVIRYVSHRVGVMYLGEIVELADAAAIYSNPMHPYTVALLSAVPVPDPRRIRKRIILGGDVPSPIDPPPGCRFNPRCPKAMPICSEQPPKLRTVNENHTVRCHLYGSG